MEKRPLVVVGSGPAGTATALALHRRDPALAADSLILDKARHPRGKVCAGGLIPAGLRWMEEHDVPLSVPHVIIDRASVTTPRRTLEHEDRDLCVVIRRNELDASLARACTDRGVELREEEPLREIHREADGLRLVTAKQEYLTPLVVAADGSGSLVRRTMVDPQRDAIARAIMCDVPVADGDWNGFEQRRYDFDFRDVATGLQGYRWIFPCLIDGVPHANVGVYSVTPTGATMKRALADHLRALTSDPPRHCAFPIRWFRRGRTRVSAPNVLLVGDAAGVDPLMGEGISLAMEYGSFAAAAAIEAQRSGDYSAVGYQRAIESSWLGVKLGRLDLARKLLYGATWRLCFALPENSKRVRALGLRWYNGVDDWDRRSGWEALGQLVRSAG
jgi:flavin-dependent dehydrogenase